MDKGRIAETGLAILCGRARATEIVGDLLEQPNSRFWWPIFTVVAAVIWRWVAAFILAALSVPLFIAQYAHLMGPVAEHTKLTVLPGSGWFIAGICVWSVFVLNAIANDHPGRLSVVAALSAFALIAVGVAIPFGFGNYAFAAAGTCILACAIAPALRRDVLCTLLAAGSFAGVFTLLIQLLNLLQPVSPLFGGSISYATALLSFVIEAWVLTRSQRWLARDSG